MRRADQPEVLILDADTGAGTRDAHHLLHDAQRLLDVQDHGDGEDRVEPTVGEGQSMSVRVPEDDPPFLA